MTVFVQQIVTFVIFLHKNMTFCFNNRDFSYLCKRKEIKVREMKRFYFDLFTKQALSVLHRYRAVMFSPTVVMF